VMDALVPCVQNDDLKGVILRRQPKNLESVTNQILHFVQNDRNGLSPPQSDIHPEGPSPREGCVYPPRSPLSLLTGPLSMILTDAVACCILVDVGLSECFSNGIKLPANVKM
jgi:hypothetical protein